MTLFRSLLLAIAGLLLPASAAADRVTLNFNAGWRFIKDDPAGAQTPAFDDARWAVVSTPHTYNDVDTFDDWSTPGHRGEQIQWSGRTWHRKTFDAPEAWKGRKVFVEFEAARQIAEVYFNGRLLGVIKTGFTPFGFDLTPQANPNLAQLHREINETIPDRLEDLQADLIPWNNPHWHPAHGGLYRNVRLHVTDPLYIPLPLFSFLETTGPYAYATGITPAAAQVTVEVTAVRSAMCWADARSVRTGTLDAAGRAVLTLETAQRRSSRPLRHGGGAPAASSGRSNADPLVATVRGWPHCHVSGRTGAVTRDKWPW